MNRRIALGLLCAAALAAVPFAGAAAADREIYTGILSDTAVGGYDPVAYFTEGRPVPGSRRHTTTWKGATWRFASASNLALFTAEPARYAPSYGGHCSWAAAQGYTAKGDPQNWKIVDGRLFLNYDASIHRKWQADIPGFIATADRNWPGIVGR